MIRRILLHALGAALAAAPAAAHPGIGIVMDRRGHVYYTDLRHVWRIAPDGRVSIAVRDVHAHELALDATGAVIGEDVRFVGGDRYRNRVWRVDSAGRVTDVQPWREGFWRDYGLSRDRDGTSYVVRCIPVTRCTLQKRTAAGDSSDAAPNTVFARGLFSLTSAPGGGVYLADGPAVKRVDAAGRVTTVARSLGRDGAAGIFGLFAGARGEVYAAVYGTRSVERIDSAGRVTTIATSPAPWAPTGVLVARDGTLWILEYSTSNEARVRRISPRGAVRTFAAPPA